MTNSISFRVRDEVVDFAENSGFPAPTPQKLKNAKDRREKSRAYDTEIDHFSPPVSEGSPVPASRRRRRTVKEAIQFFDREVKLPPNARREALARIRHSKQPGREAKRLIERHRRDGIPAPCHSSVDLSDVQELRVQLIRRDGFVCSPVTLGLSRLERQVLTENLTADEFTESSMMLLNLPHALPREMCRREATSRAFGHAAVEKRRATA
jgi:hypothetical protein